MIVNRRARRDYRILSDEYEAGMALSGAEVKGLREGRGSLNEAFVRIKAGEVWVYNLVIPKYGPADPREYDPARPRKLLLHREEILAVEKKMGGRNLTLVPLKCYTRGRYVKLRLGLGEGRKKYEKKELKKRQDIERETARTLKWGRIDSTEAHLDKRQADFDSKS